MNSDNAKTDNSDPEHEQGTKSEQAQPDVDHSAQVKSEPTAESEQLSEQPEVSKQPEKHSETAASPEQETDQSANQQLLDSTDSDAVDSDSAATDAVQSDDFEAEAAQGTADPVAEEDQNSDPDSKTLQHPIPPPSEPRQYRAIGLVRGRYTASEEQFTQGILLTTDGAIVDAVLLGRVMSLVKKHIDLEQDHLWVVYPRTRQNEGNLHVQIVGVWEPETLNQSGRVGSDDDEVASDDKVKSSAAEEMELPEDTELSADEVEALSELEAVGSEVEPGYFSVRGEVVYQSQEEERYVIVKIRQASRKENEKPKFFKLKLNGIAGPKAVGHFWDLHAQLSKDMLTIQESHDIGQLPRKPPINRRGGGGGGRDRRRPSSSRPTAGEKPKIASRSESGSRPTKPQPKVD
ncbi:MAG: hypothetical protein ACFBSC_03525 [Microcoleaceae cyanobacterium]